MTTSFIGGVHPNTASIRNVLAVQGAVFSEALLLGIGGGLGAGYILWEFKSHGSPNIVMWFRNRAHYAAERMRTLCERLGAAYTEQETSGAKGAAAHLQAALEAGQPFITWVDKAHLPYQQLPEALKAYISTVVGVHGQRGDELLIDDLGDQLYSISSADFAAARGRISSDKNRLLRVTPGTTDLPSAIRAGIADHIEHVGGDSDSFALPVYKKWAKMLTDTKNKKGWPTVFANRKGLYGTLASVYQGITFDGSDGAGLRLLYADFLDEAAGLLGQNDLKDAAAAYRALAAPWQAFADAALPAKPFAETRDLLKQKYALLRRNQQDKLRPVAERLETLEREMNDAFPLDDAAVQAHFSAMQSALQTVYEAEVAALTTLKAVSPAR